MCETTMGRVAAPPCLLSPSPSVSLRLPLSLPPSLCLSLAHFIYARTLYITDMRPHFLGRQLWHTQRGRPDSQAPAPGTAPEPVAHPSYLGSIRDKQGKVRTKITTPTPTTEPPV